MKQYFVVIKCEGKVLQSIRSEKELAELWQVDNDYDVYEEIKAWEYVDGDLQQVSVYKIAVAYLKEQEEIRKEYEDYCETVREYGYDYYEDQDNLEMGFNPYMGCYDDDC